MLLQKVVEAIKKDPKGKYWFVRVNGRRTLENNKDFQGLEEGETVEAYNPTMTLATNSKNGPPKKEKTRNVNFC